MRGKLHAAALVVSVPALVAVVGAARDGASRTAAWVYGLSACLLYLTSATYHCLTTSGRPRAVMRRLDHSMIYVLCAGSATVPVVACTSGRWTAGLLAATWGAAAVGVVLRGVVPGRAHNLAHGLYLGTGWALVVLVPAMWAASPAAAALVVAGGVVYTAGAVAFFNHWPRRRSAVFMWHEWWHLATVVGGALVFAGNYLLVAG